MKIQRILRAIFGEKASRQPARTDTFYRDGYYTFTIIVKEPPDRVDKLVNEIYMQSYYSVKNAIIRVKTIPAEEAFGIPGATAIIVTARFFREVKSKNRIVTHPLSDNLVEMYGILFIKYVHKYVIEREAYNVVRIFPNVDISMVAKKSGPATVEVPVTHEEVGRRHIPEKKVSTTPPRPVIAKERGHPSPPERTLTRQTTPAPSITTSVKEEVERAPVTSEKPSGALEELTTKRVEPVERQIAQKLEEQPKRGPTVLASVQDLYGDFADVDTLRRYKKIIIKMIERYFENLKELDPKKTFLIPLGITANGKKFVIPVTIGENNHMVTVATTGSGKTFGIRNMIKEFIVRGFAVSIIVPSSDLLVLAGLPEILDKYIEEHGENDVINREVVRKIRINILYPKGFDDESTYAFIRVVKSHKIYSKRVRTFTFPISSFNSSILSDLLSISAKSGKRGGGRGGLGEIQEIILSMITELSKILNMHPVDLLDRITQFDDFLGVIEENMNNPGLGKREQDAMAKIYKRAQRFAESSEVNSRSFTNLLVRIEKVFDQPEITDSFSPNNTLRDLIQEIDQPYTLNIFLLPAVEGTTLSRMLSAFFVSSIIEILYDKRKNDYVLLPEITYPHFVIIDEFQEYLRYYPNIAGTIDKLHQTSRKYGLYVHLITPEPKRLPPSVYEQSSVKFIAKVNTQDIQQVILDIAQGDKDIYEMVQSVIPSLSLMTIKMFMYVDSKMQNIPVIFKHVDEMKDYYTLVKNEELEPIDTNSASLGGHELAEDNQRGNSNNDKTERSEGG